MFMLSEAWHRQVPVSDFLSAKKHIQYFWDFEINSARNSSPDLFPNQRGL